MTDVAHHEPEEFAFGADLRVSPGRVLRELVAYRECVWSFASRSLRVRYKQAALGLAWAVLQPLVFLGVFILLFNGIGNVQGGGGASYSAFALAALIPWQFVSSGVAFGGDALIQDSGLLRKVYFPREAPVLGAILSYVPDFLIGLTILLLATPLTGAHLDWELIFVPLLFVTIALPAMAIALPVAALAVYFRDFKYALPFAVQVWLFASPVAYPVTEVDHSWRWVYALVNPVVGPLDSFRRVLAVGESPDWGLLGISVASSIVLLAIGYRIFKRLEREFADVV
jgi:lipopolysaccharide transport system permease protein